MKDDGLPKYSVVDQYARPHHRRRRKQVKTLAYLSVLVGIFYFAWTSPQSVQRQPTSLLSTARLQADYATCAKLRSVPQDPSGHRERNARYIDGHKAVLIRNATVWTGEPAAGTSEEDARAGKGYAWIAADVFLEHGLIKRVEAGIDETSLSGNYDTYDARGRQLTAGIVDMHSHAGVDTLPELRGWSDDNELSNDITPFVRSIDGFNPLDHQIQVIKSGGVTTSLILPGSGNNMGGEAYVVKHAVGKADGREEISAEDMLADPEGAWRYMKMACGENAKSVYGRVGRDFGPFSRLGEAWYFRHAFEEATAMVNAQDDWCAAAEQIGAKNMGKYLPQELKWESLGALLRGQVLLNVHCYTIPDLEAFVKLTNEFKFKLRAFHHAHQTYLVPEILKRAYGGRPPAAALFADNMYYKAEAYIASENAGRILWENGITPVYVSDNPVLNAQHVVFEAAKAYRNGLPYHVALAGVTSASAELLGLGERIGKVKAGFDADIVVWDSDPLSVGAAPVQVWIDGTPQFEDPVELVKSVGKPLEPSSGAPNRTATSSSEHTNLILSGISRVILPYSDQTFNPPTSAVILNSTLTCIGGSCSEDSIFLAHKHGAKTLTLQNGYIVPPATAFASSLGLSEIDAEDSTRDGENSENSFSRAVDGLAFDTKELKTAYARGVTKAITPPLFQYRGHKGLSAGFLTGASHALEDGAVWKDEVALHYTLAKTEKTPTISSHVGLLRSALIKSLTANETTASVEEKALKRAALGDLPLAITVHSADTIAALLRLKADVEDAVATSTITTPKKINLILIGAAESPLLAPSLSSTNTSVLLSPFLAYSTTWAERRSLTGAPLTNVTAIDVLHAAGVTVAIGTSEDWETRDLYLYAGIAFANGGGAIGEGEAVGFVSGAVDDMLRLEGHREKGREFVVFENSPLEITGRVRAVSDGRGGVTLFE